MKIFVQFLTVLFLIVGFTPSLSAQKIGYVYVNAVFGYMPETNSMEEQLGMYQKKLNEQLAIKRNYAQQKLQEAEQKVQEGANEQELARMREELIKLDEELQQAEEEADRKFNEKRQELFAPISEKVSTVIQEIATDLGYTYILNAIDSNGTSIILHGPPEHDLTRQVMQGLGIEVPAAPTPVPDHAKD
ncbi:MAG: OmpH family outer membrane protein [Bacteroidota bacterium]